MKLHKFFSELERRKVYKAAIAYGISAWVIAQIAGLVSASFEFPSWVMKLIIIILIVGFLTTMVLSWIFDFGPKGIERTEWESSDLSDEKKPITGKLVISFLILISVLIGAGWWTWQGLVINNVKPIKSLAILPFDNFTGNDKLEYFVAGMHSSLIGDMQKISALRVPGTTSSNSFKDVKMSIPEIASALKVDALIEASVSCIKGDSVCIQIRLVRVYPEEQQLWVQDYYEDKSKILNLYNRVTKQISEEVNVILTPQEENLLAESKTVDPEAYDAYLMGQFYWEKLDKESAEKALEYFQLAIEIDPEWADPYAGLANAWGVFSFFGFLPKSVTLPKVYKYMNKALELDTNSARAHYVKAIVAVWTEWDWEKGEKEFLRSLELNPNDALSRMYYAHLLMILRRSDEAVQQANLGLELDPLKPLGLGLYGVVMKFEGDYQSAILHFEKALSIDPNFDFAKGNLADTQMRVAYKNGDYKKWFESWDKKVGSRGRWNDEGRTAVLNIFHEKGHIAAIEEMFKMNEKYGDSCYMSNGIKAERYLKLEKYDKAMECLERDYEMQNNAYIATKPYYDQLKDNPRYIELLRKMNLPLGDKHQKINK